MLRFSSSGSPTNGQIGFKICYVEATEQIESDFSINN